MIWAILLFSMVFLVLVMLGTVIFMKYFVRHTVGNKHRELESILDTREIPGDWLKDSKGESGAFTVERRLAKLVRYVRHTRLVDNEETRSILLEELAAVREEWGERDQWTIRGKKDVLRL